MAFTEDEVRDWALGKEAEDHLLWLIEFQNVMAAYVRVSEFKSIKGGKAAVAMAKGLKGMCRQLTVAVEMDAVDESDFDVVDPDFNRQAQQIDDVRDYLEGRLSELEAYMTRHVTIFRRKGMMSRTVRSLGNKFSNALTQEMHLLTKWIKKCDSFSAPI